MLGDCRRSPPRPVARRRRRFLVHCGHCHRLERRRAEIMGDGSRTRGILRHQAARRGGHAHASDAVHRLQ